jgi:anti-sigma factor RsiW
MLFMATMAMLVMVGVGAILYALPKQIGKQNRELVNVALENHVGISEGKIPFDIMSSEPAVILKWLEQGVDFPILIPQEEVSDMRLVGARLVHLNDSDGKRAAILTYESKENEKVSLLMTRPQFLKIIDGKAIPFKGISFYLTHYRGYYALAWTDKYMSYVLVSDQKARIAEACRICHESTRRQDIIGFDDQI